MPRPLLAVAIVCLAAQAWGRAEGIDSRGYFPPLGCGAPDGGNAGCHTQDVDPALTVTLAGPDEIAAGPRGGGLFTLSMPPGFRGLEGAGMNVAIAAPNTTGCALAPVAPPGRMAFRNESADPNDPVLSHDYEDDPPPWTLIGVWSYQFLVSNCKTPGRLLLIAVMNAFDGSGDETGEAWGEATHRVTIPEPGEGAARIAALGALAIAARMRRVARCPLSMRRTATDEDPRTTLRT